MQKKTFLQLFVNGVKSGRFLLLFFFLPVKVHLLAVLKEYSLMHPMEQQGLMILKKGKHGTAGPGIKT